MKGVRCVPILIFFACGSSVVPKPFVEKIFFLCYVTFTLLSKIVDYMWAFFWDFYSVSLMYLSVPSHNHAVLIAVYLKVIVLVS